MALTTYTELKAAVASWLNRDDLTTQIPDFITLCEARLKRTLRTRHTSILQATLSAGDTSLALPSGLTEILSISTSDAVNNSRVLTTLSYPQLMEKRRFHTTAGVPVWCAVVGETVEFAPAPDDDYTVNIEVEGPLVALSDSAPSNWILDDYPDVYLYGALAESAPFLREDERVPLWNGRFQAAIDELEAARSRSLWPSAITVPVPDAFSGTPPR